MEDGTLPSMMDRKHTPMNALQQLIADYLADHPGETYSSIARRGDMSKQNVQAIATKKAYKQSVLQDTIPALARGLETSESVVRAAAADAAGFGIEGLRQGDETLLVAQYRDLDPRDAEELQRRLRYLAAEARERRARETGE